MDIRDMLKAQKPKKKTTQRASPVIIDDEEDANDFQQPLKGKTSSKHKNRKRIKYESDSDDEVVTTTKKPKSAAGSGTSSSQARKKITSLSEYFGSDPVKRQPEAMKGGRKLTTEGKDLETIPNSPLNEDIDKVPTVKKSSASQGSSTKKASPIKRTASLPSESSTPPAKKIKPLASKIVPQDGVSTPTKRHQQKPPVSKGTPESNKLGSSSSTPPVAKTTATKKMATPNVKPPTTPSLQKSASKGQQYSAYLNRGGPSAPGSKPIPDGAEGCLTGLTFVVTGVLDSLERDEVQRLVQKYNGKVTQSISKKTSYLVTGSDPGQSKLAKAVTLDTKQIDEDGLLELIRTLPGKGQSQAKPSTAKGKKSASTTIASKEKPAIGSEEDKSAASVEGDKGVETKQPQFLPVAADKEDSKCPPEQLMWVDKYRPELTKHIIGHQGDNSKVKKLLAWLRDWEKNYLKGVKKGTANSTARFGRDDGATCRAALLSGPPGVGKTTAATLACKETGYSFVELNASSTRSKKSIQEQVADQLSTCSILAFSAGSGDASAGRRHALVMDEVDGMAGNEDRGGIPELIKLIKTSHVPIICICNDRQHIKIRSLSNYCYDLRFAKPKVDQIKGAMMRVVYREGVKITSIALEELIVASKQDLRQVLHNMALWSAGDKTISADQDGSRIKKALKLGPFDGLKEVFVRHGNSDFVSAKSELFFMDYSIMPLFVQENYLSVRPANAKGNTNLNVLDQISKAADAISYGNLVEKQLRTTSNWSLLPTQAIFSTVLPGQLLQGHLTAKIAFPQWLGNYSKATKQQRLLQELRQHSRLRTSCNQSEMGMDYLHHFQYRLTSPLLTEESEGTKKVISFLDSYDLTREDWDSVVELCHISGSPDILSRLAPKVKTAFTKAYNAAGLTMPYSLESAAVKKSTAAAMAASGDGEWAEDSNEEETTEESTDLGRDAMIKVKGGKGKQPKKSSSSKQKSKPATNKNKKYVSHKKN